MSESRDTQFAGFASLLFDELYNVSDVYFDTGELHWHEEWREVIAKRAFDLVTHALEHAFTHNVVFESPEDCASRIPDITTFEDIGL